MASERGDGMDVFERMTQAGDELARALARSPGIDPMRGVTLSDWHKAKEAAHQQLRGAVDPTERWTIIRCPRCGAQALMDGATVNAPCACSLRVGALPWEVFTVGLVTDRGAVGDVG